MSTQASYGRSSTRILRVYCTIHFYFRLFFFLLCFFRTAVEAFASPFNARRSEFYETSESRTSFWVVESSTFNNIQSLTYTTHTVRSRYNLPTGMLLRSANDVTYLSNALEKTD